MVRSSTTSRLFGPETPALPQPRVKPRVRRLRPGPRICEGALAMALAGLASPALAQGVPETPTAAPRAARQAAADPDENEVDELVVTAGRVTRRGSVVGDIPPELTLSPRDIRAAGVSSVAELLDYLAPQISSGQGRGGERPVTLVNGARISSFAEIRDIPTEAIVRVEVLPEEVSLKYGYRADQKVVNFILRRRFNATTAEVGASGPTAGGQGGQDVSTTHLRILKDNRFQLSLKASRATSLLESERDLLQDPDARPYDVIGNVTAAPFAPGAAIDPALSALAGRAVDVAPVPAGLSRAPTLADFVGVARRTDEGAYRTLLPSTDSATINAVATHTLGNGVSATLNASLEMDDSRSRLGLSSSSLLVPADNPFSPFANDVAVQRYDNGLKAIRRSTDSLTGHLGLAVNGARSGWRWSFTGNADRALTRTLTDGGVDISALQAAVSAGDPAVNPFAPIPADYLHYAPPDRTRSVVTSADAELVAIGNLFDVPAGGVSATFKGGFETTDLDSDTLRLGVQRSVDLSRQTGSAQASFDLPIASRRKGVMQPLGDLSLNANFELDQLSDFGSLTTYGFGANWSPVKPLRVIASFTEEDGAPTIQQLGNPTTVTPGVRVFDFRTGQTVEVTRIEGGSPGLTADSRRVMKLGLTLKPFEAQNLTFRADYVRSRIRDAIASFPTATSEIEAAFPERFVRDASGRLLQVDVRPVNFEREDRQQLRWGFNYSKPLGPVRRPGEGRPGGYGDGDRPGPPADGERGRAGQGGGGRGGGGFGGGGFGGGGFGGGGPRGGGALQFALFHTWTFKDDVLIRNGAPVMDLLDGSALGSGGGQPRHQIDAQAGVTKNGLGARLTGKWSSATQVRGGPFGGEDLRFSDLTTVGVRVFADLGRQPFAQGRPWLRGARVSLSIENLFDARQKVRAADGTTPISYQPDYLDPAGRTIKLSLRKVFF